MTWFSLPAVGRDNPPAFSDMEQCTAWLSTQPLANAPLMQDVLAAQLDALNCWEIPPRERFKILETLRKPIFAIATESSKRYDGRPLPLSGIEQKAFEGSCLLWQRLTTGYLHCLRACLDQDASLADHRAKIAHRVLTSLRLEQIARYRAGATIPGSWWRTLHATLASADQLGISGTAVSDRLFAETRESTPAGQYAMALLLHLARPFELSRSQFSAALRWLARWREQAKIFQNQIAAGDARTVVIDLASNQPVHAGKGAPDNGRWLAIDAVLGKFKGRAKALRDGKSPEELNLGTNLPPDACIGLLQFLHGALQSPPAPPPPAEEMLADVRVATTVEQIHRLLGGKSLKDVIEPTAQSNRKLHEQIAIFGHVVREEAPLPDAGLEQWQLLVDQAPMLILRRLPNASGERLGNRCLIGMRTADGNVRLAIFRSLATLEDGSLLAWAKVLPGAGQAVTATARERVTNRIIPYPAVFLPSSGQTSGPASLFLPAGATAKLIRLDASDLPDGMKIGAPLDRGTNFERLRCE